MKDGAHTSPDGRFTIVSKTGDGEFVRISVRAKSNPQKIIYKSDFVDGFTWLPNREHTLVFAVGADNNGETPGIFVWQSGKRPRLIKGLENRLREDIALLGVSRDGRKIAYHYWPNSTGIGVGSNREPFVKSLRLP